MRNPFAKPHTAGQWLLGSVCWTVAGGSGWWLVTALCNASYEGPLGLALGIPVQLLLWRRAVPRGRALLEPATYSLLIMLGWQWWLLLHLLLLVILPLLTLRQIGLLWALTSW